ncbi:type II toxin-antitoxin system RelE/ParE family toxin [Streptomyces sp. NPDC002785]|uniref:type II toxin-antitoxin system RelE family toxin n=1 Tax=Streptomyces sp. NPDC002785 TaxID=3154543 RepID=UPI0033208F18
MIQQVVVWTGTSSVLVHTAGGPLGGAAGDQGGDGPVGGRVILASAEESLQRTPLHGSPTLRRVHVGRYRVLYEITEAQVTIIVIHLGRVG